MKKLLFVLIVFTLLILASCNTDDNKTPEVNDNVVSTSPNQETETKESVNQQVEETTTETEEKSESKEETETSKDEPKKGNISNDGVNDDEDEGWIYLG